MKQIALSTVGMLLALTVTANAYADDDDDDTMAESVSTESGDDAGGGEAAGEATGGDADGVRFRFGAQAGAGFLSGGGLTLGYGGADVRLGVQINDLIGIYAQPQLGIYSGNFGGTTGAGGLLGVSGVADFTFLDHFFAGVGAGLGVLNNPSGAEIHFRLGGYPFVGGGEKQARRHGLMAGMDLRLHFVANETFVAPTFCLGYEAF